MKKSSFTLVGFCLTLPLMTSCYLSRCLFWGGAVIEDIERFPSRPITNQGPAFTFSRGNVNLDTLMLDYTYKKQPRQSALHPFLETTGSVSFLVIHNDSILYERYFNGYADTSIVTSFSIAKAFVSMLVGIAIREGSISSITDPITKYLPELEDPACSNVTIEHLLTMVSGIKHTWGNHPFSDAAKAYYSTDLRKMLLKVQCEEPPLRHRSYNNCNTQLLGMILERVTGSTISAYLEKKIWKPLGMTASASWSMDHKKDGFEISMAGLNATTLDFAKFGRLLLNGGEWNEQQIIPNDWVKQATDVRRNLDLPWNTFADHYNGANVSYGYGLWGTLHEGRDPDFFGWGMNEQYIYVIPSRNVIVLRFGRKWGKIDYWPVVLRQVAMKVTEAD